MQVRKAGHKLKYLKYGNDLGMYTAGHNICCRSKNKRKYSVRPSAIEELRTKGRELIALCQTFTTVRCVDIFEGTWDLVWGRCTVVIFSYQAQLLLVTVCDQWVDSPVSKIRPIFEINVSRAPEDK